MTVPENDILDEINEKIDRIIEVLEDDPVK
jgi:hypothetical protein